MMKGKAGEQLPRRGPIWGGSLLRLGATYLGLIIVDAFALYLIYAFAADGIWELAITIGVITLGVNIINLRADLYALRWIAPALSLMTLLVVFPIVYTVYVSFTNYGDGNLLTKTQVLKLLAQQTYLPDGGKVYGWTLYQNNVGDFALWLTDESAGDAYYFATPESFEPVTSVLAGGDLPDDYKGYRQLSRGESLQAVRVVQELTFGNDDLRIGIAGRRDAGEFEQRYEYLADQDAVLDHKSGRLFRADYDSGQFVNEDGAFLFTGFISAIGADNYQSFIDRDDIRSPLARIFMWTIGFSLVSVLSTFSLGLFFALLLQNRRIPFKKAFRTILIIPWPIPGLISVAIWRGMLNSNLGVVSNIIRSFGLEPPPFFIDAGWAKFGIILVNLWLGYPYFMLVCSGALAAIPSDMYEAAEVDGANWWQKFRGLTLPMLLVAVGPLLIASFTYNFNNFVIIEAFNEGGPPMVEAGTLPAGHTDILISYAYRLAFGGGRGANYGLASAITIIIFLMVAGVTLAQYQLTKGWEETSENV
ncbi:MAG: ABC transporter permease subunit [Chloroflexi bacterium]|nr:ABC transporter permease subunit [Chloroflexota bacterium]